MSASFGTLPEWLVTLAPEQGEIPLGSLLSNDLEARWKAGQRLTVEDYLQHFPALRERVETLLDLLYSEWLLREQFGPPPSMEE